ncbi:MAG: virulence protein [Clostridia bacterium]|nr:virulence protein [Clostridia bacterium]
MFTFYFKQSGAARKPFVKAVSEILEAKPKYLGMPSAAYEIDVFTITKDGNIELDERTDSELVENLIDRLVERGYEAEPVEGWEEEEKPAEDEHAGEQLAEEERTGEEETADKEPAGEQPTDEQPIEEQPTDEQPAEEQPAEEQPTDEQPAEEQPAEEQPTDEQPIEERPVDEDITMTISMPRGIMTDAGLENLKRLVWAKGALLRQAFAVENTEIEVTDEAISFPWFNELTPEELKYAAQFISGMCKFANNSKRITSKQRSEGNPKFAMRVWLIRMGFSGAENKGLRKYLLRNLPGDAAFRYGRPEAEENTTGKGEVEDGE